ncbi:hypothetical protein [Ligilactobacillus ruminis]|uniref:hypothetical protein n=1 Tax=Ligilactobacillus ruminis TaxID=1623 RepID=UPI001475DE27|nr:hypothetical protein [Ligilactobacillus ruminis]NME32330.1 hypothetical protein [Ligilactobacillus ruminis]
MQIAAIDVLCRLIWQNRCNVSDVYGQNLKTGDLTVSSPWRESENRQKTGELPLFYLPDTSNPDSVVSDYKQIPKRTFCP